MGFPTHQKSIILENKKITQKKHKKLHIRNWNLIVIYARIDWTLYKDQMISLHSNWRSKVQKETIRSRRKLQRDQRGWRTKELWIKTLYPHCEAQSTQIWQHEFLWAVLNHSHKNAEICDPCICKNMSASPPINNVVIQYNPYFASHQLNPKGFF